MNVTAACVSNTMVEVERNGLVEGCREPQSHFESFETSLPQLSKLKHK